MPLQQPIYIFADLDDSLFQTKRKCPETSALVTAAKDRNGGVLSYFTGEQKILVTFLQQGTLIPVTGRNTAALNRVQLQFTSYRITSHGAMVLDSNGKPDEEWLTLIQAQCIQWRENLSAVLAQVENHIVNANLALRCRVIDDQGVSVYVSIKGEEGALRRLLAKVWKLWKAEGVQVHHNGENMALLPPFANKARAVAFLMQRLRGAGVSPLFMGIGDSLTDLPFLRLCHYAIIPRGSQIQEMIGA